MLYDEFRDCENATIVIKSQAASGQDSNFQPIYVETEVFNGSGIFYELNASEKIARSQIQKSATGQVILDPSKVTTVIDETMSIYVTTAKITDEKYRMVTENDPLNLGDAIIIDIIEN